MRFLLIEGPTEQELPCNIESDQQYYERGSSTRLKLNYWMHVSGCGTCRAKLETARDDALSLQYKVAGSTNCVRFSDVKRGLRAQNHRDTRRTRQSGAVSES